MRLILKEIKDVFLYHIRRNDPVTFDDVFEIIVSVGFLGVAAFMVFKFL